MMRCIRRQILPKVAKKISEAQFGGVPGKGTREAVLVTTEFIARFHKATQGLGKSRNPPMYLAAVLFDLEKALDKVDGRTTFAALSAKPQMAGLDMYLEEMHNGSVEGPLIFVACYDLVLHGIQARRGATELYSISACSRATLSGDEVVVLVNEIAFVETSCRFSSDGMDPSSDRVVRDQPP